MKIVDIFIGLLIMNASFHFVLGVWKQRMLTSFGFGHTKNILYGFLNAAISVGLFIYSYGLDALLENGIYVGTLLFFVIISLGGKVFYNVFTKPSKDA